MKNKIKLLIILTLIFALTGCSAADISSTSVGETPVISEGTERQSAALESSPDMGQEYIDSLIFFGESTTYHLKSRGVLRDGKNTKQVWAPQSGTVNLDTAIDTLEIIYPQTGEKMTVGRAVALSKPKIMVLTFGLNGAVQKIKRGEEYFKSCYTLLIDEIRYNSPDTVIILQSCFPIAESMDMSNYSVDAKALNNYITQINSWTQTLAYKSDCAYLNTTEVLCNESGFLKSEYDSGDGHHLTTEAYNVILEYIRTHGYN